MFYLNDMLGLSALSFLREIEFLSKTFVGEFKSVSFLETS